MKKAIAIIVVIAIVLVGVGGYLVWKGYKDGYFTPDYISKEYEVEDFDNININLESSDVLFKKASDGKAKVECQELEKLYHEVKVEDKVLATGEGKSKKLAEMQAAQKALEIIK